MCGCFNIMQKREGQKRKEEEEAARRDRVKRRLQVGCCVPHGSVNLGSLCCVLPVSSRLQKKFSTPQPRLQPMPHVAGGRRRTFLRQDCKQRTHPAPVPAAPVLTN